MNSNLIKVSVYCLAFNHVKFIKKTLDGFVNQKTDFNFEVYVHDDASTDGTQEIIKEYAEKYPNIIKPILQKENQFSQGVRITRDILFPKFKGKYIAICEGDDYWTNDNKLQIQYDFLEKNEEYVACVHNTVKIIDGHITKELINPLTINTDLNLKDVILRGSSQFQTSSIMYRKELLEKNKRPCFLDSIKGVGDYPLAVYLAISGKIFFYIEVMSAYRINAPGSWSNEVESKKESHIKVRKDCINMLKEANRFSNYRYNDDFNYAILYHEYDIELLSNGKIKKKKKYLPLLKGKNLKNSIKFLWNTYLPKTYFAYSRIKSTFKKRG